MRIFNQLRIKQIKEGRLGRYLTYALGEIILVVIGILIALNINNWNEHRKSEKRLETILDIVRTDMQNDTTELSAIISYYESQEEIYLDVLADSNALSGGFGSEDYIRILNFYTEWNLEMNGYMSLQNYGSDFSGDSLIQNLLLQYGVIKRLSDGVSEELKRDVTDNVIFFRDNYSWFSNFVVNASIDSDLSEMLQSTEYKNRVAYHYTVLFKNYLPVLRAVKQIFARELQAIEERIK